MKITCKNILKRSNMQLHAKQVFILIAEFYINIIFVSTRIYFGCMKKICSHKYPNTSKLGFIVPFEINISNSLLYLAYLLCQLFFKI